MKKSKKEATQKPICVGTGLVALDIVISSDPIKGSEFFAGGSCGNVLTILSYLGWNSLPIARLSNNAATDLLIQDMTKWGVQDLLLSFSEDGSTPIIIHRILRDKHGVIKHRFEFRNPEDGKYLPSYKPYLSAKVPEILNKGLIPTVFYFDRINRASIDLAQEYKKLGSTIFFEPSSIKDKKGFQQCLKIADIVKFSEDRLPDYEVYFPTGQVPLEIKTLGEKGLAYRKKGVASWRFVNAFIIDGVKDTAGAGDWCTAGILYTLFSSASKLKLEDKLLNSAIKFGQVLSALNCTYEGARGLMYNMSSAHLIKQANLIVSNKASKIILSSNNSKIKEHFPNNLKISSLFAMA